MSLLGVLVYWITLASTIPAIGVIASSVAAAAVPLVELLLVFLVLSSTCGALLNVHLGGTVESWSTFGHVTKGMLRNLLVGACNHSVVARMILLLQLIPTNTGRV